MMSKSTGHVHASIERGARLDQPALQCFHPVELSGGVARESGHGLVRLLQDDDSLSAGIMDAIFRHRDDLATQLEVGTTRPQRRILFLLRENAARRARHRTGHQGCAQRQQAPHVRRTPSSHHLTPIACSARWMLLVAPCSMSTASW